jgi:hypothetical protein
MILHLLLFAQDSISLKLTDEGIRTAILTQSGPRTVLINPSRSTSDLSASGLDELATSYHVPDGAEGAIRAFPHNKPSGTLRLGADFFLKFPAEYDMQEGSISFGRTERDRTLSWIDLDVTIQDGNAYVQIDGKTVRLCDSRWFSCLVPADVSVAKWIKVGSNGIAQLSFVPLGNESKVPVLSSRDKHKTFGSEFSPFGICFDVVRFSGNRVELGWNERAWTLRERSLSVAFGLPLRLTARGGEPVMGYQRMEWRLPNPVTKQMLVPEGAEKFVIKTFNGFPLQRRLHEAAYLTQLFKSFYERNGVVDLAGEFDGRRFEIEFRAAE